MKLNKREIEILDFLMHKNAQAKEIAAALNMKKPNLAKYLKKLESYGLITIATEHKKRIFILNTSVSFGFLRAADKFPSIRLTEVLVGKLPFLLSFIRAKKRFKLKDIDLPPITAKRLLKKLRNSGLVFMQSKGNYELRGEACPLAEFCRNVLMLIYAARAKHELKGIIIAKFSFNSPKELEVVFGTDKKNNPENYWPTAYSVFHEYGINLVLAGKYYYSNIEPKIEDAIIHSLALGIDARTIAYVSALMLKNKFNYDKLLKKKQRFDISEEFLRELISFVGAKEGFPSWKEVEEVADAI